MLRQDLVQIANWIEDDSLILDLGCGDGTLLAHLRDSHKCAGYGIEIADASVLECVRRQVNVIQADLESGLRMFADAMFDTVVLSQTLQAMHNVESILREMVRVGRRGIVSFPNFGHWRHAVSLLAGHMPVTPDIPYQWYDTPNIHLCTPKDFELLAARLGLRITDRALLAAGQPVALLRNLRANVAVYRFEKR
ncbi:Methionine biosynthesis protein MetW [Burkholderiales bacterium]|jgi:methionine biosynthesis protein MetW|nr:Methionine biosynthesis protein MetW [Burkholderiales bacterium]